MTAAGTDSSLAIDLRDVAKRYRGRVDALRGIEMHVRRGEIFGLLGPNGAGKSTLVKIILSLVRPTRAAGTVLGRPVGHKPTLARTGYLPENHRFPRYLTGRQVVEFFAALAGVDRRTRKRRAAELLHTVNMTADADRRVGTYSKGMAQRVGLAQAMANDPDLILLDEPTDGVDPVGRREIRDVLLDLRRQGKTVFINSHLLSELEMICDRVAILIGGQVVRQGTLGDLTLAQQRYEIEVVPGAGGAARPLGEVLGATAVTGSAAGASPPPLPYESPRPSPQADGPPPLVERMTLPGGIHVEVHRNVLRVAGTDPAGVQPVIDALRAAGAVIGRVQLVRPSLEDLFIEAMGQNGGRR